MDAGHLHRLKEEQDRAIADTDRRLQQVNKFRSDYISLQEKLKTLPNKTTHGALVPFGTLAFMKGQYVHTNEILVLLGDNYFVERSACQAVDIVSRRVNKLDEDIKALQKQKELLVPRAHFTSEMIQENQGDGDQQEIVEAFDEEQELHWRKRHKEFLRLSGEKRQKERVIKNTQEPESKADERTYDELWERLNELELQESHGRELERLLENGSDTSELQPNTERVLKASSSDDIGDPSLFHESNDEEDVTEDDDDQYQAQKVISFLHTKTPDDQLTEEGSDVECEDKAEIKSPADLYKLIKTTPKSILKSQSPFPEESIKTHCTYTDAKKQKLVTFVRDSYSSVDSRKEDTCSGDFDSLRHISESKRVLRERQPSPASSEQECEVLLSSPSVQAFSGTVVERPLPSNPQALHSFPAALESTPAAPDAVFQCGHVLDNSHLPSNGQTDSENYAHFTAASLPQEQNLGASKRPLSKFRASRQKMLHK